jgi:hypothetical protein
MAFTQFICMPATSGEAFSLITGISNFHDVRNEIIYDASSLDYRFYPISPARPAPYRKARVSHPRAPARHTREQTEQTE